MALHGHALAHGINGEAGGVCEQQHRSEGIRAELGGQLGTRVVRCVAGACAGRGRAGGTATSFAAVTAVRVGAAARLAAELLQQQHQLLEAVGGGRAVRLNKLLSWEARWGLQGRAAVLESAESAELLQRLQLLSKGGEAACCGQTM